MKNNENDQCCRDGQCNCGDKCGCSSNRHNDEKNKKSHDDSSNGGCC